jgi:hypothetical protein
MSAAEVFILHDRPSVNCFFSEQWKPLEAPCQQDIPLVSISTNGTTVQPVERYESCFSWLAVLLLAFGMLIVSGIIVLVLTMYCTLVPNMLCSVASITYANVYFSTLLSATMLDMIQCTRLLWGIEVFVGNIGSYSKVGIVAFVAADEQNVMPLESKQLYR